MADPDSHTSSFYFNPSGEGLDVFLGPTEGRIMTILWKQGRVSVKGVQRILSEKTPISDSAIQTVLDRLGKQGLVAREKEGRHFLYTPLITREEFLKDRITRIEQTIARNFPSRPKSI